MNPSPSAAPALAQQLQATAQALRAVWDGRSLSDVLPRVPSPLRPGVQALVFQALRQSGCTAALLRLLAPRSPTLPVRALLQTALALTPPLTADGDAPHYDPHTLVNQTVECAKAGRDTRAQAGFINACLRRFMRDSAALLEQARRDEPALWNHPGWWIERLRRDHPDHWATVLAANNRPGAMALRVNRRRVARDVYLQALTRAGMSAHACGTDGVVLADAVPVERLPGFAAGEVSVQDSAAQWAADGLLEGLHLAPGARVLDACAAPGGKTAHLLERADLDLWALDQDAARCQRIHDNLARLGLHARVRCADAADNASWWDGQPFDAILLDAPCTASGIVRRHPDVRWLRRDADVVRLAQQQRRLLDALWPLLAPGGRLLYATCSVFRAEGADQVQSFLERHNDARQGTAPGHLLPGVAADGGGFNDNEPGEHDGFFYARLDKVAT